MKTKKQYFFLLSLINNHINSMQNNTNATTTAHNPTSTTSNQNTNNDLFSKSMKIIKIQTQKLNLINIMLDIFSNIPEFQNIPGFQNIPELHSRLMKASKELTKKIDDNKDEARNIINNTYDNKSDMIKKTINDIDALNKDNQENIVSEPEVNSLIDRLEKLQAQELSLMRQKLSVLQQLSK